MSLRNGIKANSAVWYGGQGTYMYSVKLFKILNNDSTYLPYDNI
jgi:hypothetical protein